MPWQQHVLDVALEIDPDTGLPAYREVVLTVPRQSGKTTLLLALMVHRSLGFGQQQRVTYTAQTRIAAREKWLYEHLPLLQKSALGGMFQTVLQRGEERIVWENGSIYGIESTQETAGHGNVLDLGIIDEAFARENAAGEQAMRPAMITRPDAQLWVVSTAGKTKAKSAYLWSKVAAGRARVEAGLDSTVASFEWSMPTDVDPADPASWWGCMPALGERTITERAIRGEYEAMVQSGNLNEFRRAYGNQWLDDVLDGWDVIPKSAWDARAGAAGKPDGPVAFALSAAWPKADMGSIAVAGRHGDEVYTQVIAYDRGTSWMPARVKELKAKHPKAAVVLDDKDPAAQEKPALERAGIELTPVNLTQAGQAYGMFIAAVMGDAPYLRHYGQPELDAAVAAASKRPVGDAHTWARKGADICCLVAATHAMYGLATTTADPPPEIF